MGAGVAASGAYTFASLPAGAYSLTLEGEGVVDAFSLADGSGAATFNYVVGVAPSTAIWRALCRATAVRPRPIAWCSFGKTQALLAEKSSDAAGGFRFAGLLAGRYGLAVAGSLMPVQQTTVATGRDHHCDPDLACRTPAGEAAGQLLAAWPVAAGIGAVGPVAAPSAGARLTAGASLEEAMQAAQVTIVGSEEVVSAAEEQVLQAAGCQVQRLPGDPFALAEALQL